MILVTGGFGFIGAHFILDWLASKDESIINLDALTYAANVHNLRALDSDPRHIVVHGSIVDTALVEGLLHQYRPRAIVHFAAETHVDRSLHHPEQFITANVLGTFSLLEATRAYWRTLSKHEQHLFRLVHISTDEVFGSLTLEDPPFHEKTPYAPNSPYSASKAASDHLVRAWHHSYGLPVLTTHCSNNYGPFQYPEKLIPLMIHNALAAKPLTIYGNGQNIRDWLFVGDHCAAIRAVLDKGHVGATYNIGGENEKTNIELVQMICTIMDECIPSSAGSYARLIQFVPDRPGHDQRYAMDTRKIRQELGWEPKEDFASGMRKTIRWYLENESAVTEIRVGHSSHVPIG